MENNNAPKLHIVIRGENLNSIAKRHGFSSYKPIAIFNSIRDENSLKEGQKIVIPRSRQGYDIVINNLNQLKGEMTNSTNGIANQLKVDRQVFERENKKVDLIWDTLMLTRTITKVGFKTIIASKDAVARMPALKKAMLEVVEIVSDNTVESFDKKNSKEEDQGVISNAYKVSKHKYKVAYSIGQKTFKMLDLVEVALDFIKPTTVAKYFNAYISGEHVEETEANAKKMIEQTYRKSISNLNEKIARLTRERNMLYSSQQVAMPLY